MDLVSAIDESVKYIRTKTSVVPQTGVILGTGLGDLAGILQDKVEIDYHDIPHFPVSTAPSHKGILHIGTLGNRNICMMQGRVHRYEGYSLQQVTYPVRVLKALGCTTLIVMCAVGSVNPTMRAGELVLISDHINLFGDNPLIGPNDDRLGVRFPDMSEPYSRSLMDLAQRVALTMKLSLPRGVYLGWSGPSLETAAEYRMISRLGADMVGMSTVPEVIVARHGHMDVLGIATVTNYCDYCNLMPCTEEQVVQTSLSVSDKTKRLIPAILREIASPTSCG